MSLKNSDRKNYKLAMKGDPYLQAEYLNDLVTAYKPVFSGRLLLLRIERNLSQKELAQYLSITSQAVTMMEKEKRIPSFEVLCKIADFFDVSLDYLVGRSDDPARR